MRRFPLLMLAALVTAGLIGLGGCASEPKPPPSPYVLRPVTPEGAPVPAGVPIRVRHPGIDLHVRPLTPRERELWLRENADVDVDPLGRRSGERYLSFLVRLDATGDQPVLLQTQSVRLWQEGSPAGIPALDYTRAYVLLRPDLEAPAPEQAELERFMRGLLDGSLEIMPGEHEEGLLVFPEPPRPEKEEEGLFVLELPFLQVGSKTYRVRIPCAAEELDGSARSLPAPASEETNR